MAQRRPLRVTTTPADQRDIPPTPTFFPDYGQTSPEADVFKRDEDLSPLITPSSGGWTRVEQETKFTHHQDLSPRSSQLAAATKRARFLPWSTPWHLMDARHIPAATNGFALGLMGFFGFLRLVNIAFFDASWHLHQAACFFMCWALLTQAVYFFKMIRAPGAFKDDFLMAPTNASLAAMPCTLCVLCSNLHKDELLSEWIAGFGIAIGALLYLCNVPWFMYLLYDKAAPDAYFTAGTVGVSLVAATAPGLGPPDWLLALSFWSGMIAAFSVLPRVVYRVSTDLTASPGPSVSCLQASPSFLCVAWHAGLPHDGSPHPAAFGSEWLTVLLGPILYLCSVFFVLLSVWCIRERLHVIKQSWFTPSWAAWTFPAESSASAAVHFYIRHNNSWFAMSWAILMSTVVMVVVPLFNYLYFRHLEDWLQHEPPAAYVQAYEAGVKKRKLTRKNSQP